ncbi:hypothetical protein HJFPF1_00047 [Paramyrothecium foliicola]|nr:hypothetical protein HJFPF1_00047 [Paramyrothecium foliicola]
MLLQLAVATKTFDASLTYSQQSLMNEGVIIHPAVEADLDDIVTILIDAFSPGPVWQYLYTQLDEYYDFAWHCLRQTIGEGFAHHVNTTFINVIHKSEVTDSQNEHGKRLSRVVAFAVWNVREPKDRVPHQSISNIGALEALTECSDHPEMNQTRAADYARQAKALEEDFIRNHQEDQLYLNFLATHPDWDGHGFGAAQLRWAFEKAKRVKENQTLPITLLATPAGWPLYSSVGFESLKNITITTLDDDLDDLWFEDMRFGGLTGQ